MAEVAKQPYERPVVVKQATMDFPLRVLQAGRVIVCRQCSSCHGCR